MVQSRRFLENLGYRLFSIGDAKSGSQPDYFLIPYKFSTNRPRRVATPRINPPSILATRAELSHVHHGNRCLGIRSSGLRKVTAAFAPVIASIGLSNDVQAETVDRIEHAPTINSATSHEQQTCRYRYGSQPAR